MLSLKMVVLIDLIAVIIAGVPSDVVYTETGPVQGEILTTVVNSVEYALFTGIRYGKPPIGYLRFKPPVPAEPWTEILNASGQVNQCPHYDESTSLYVGTEDCLNLNIYTPVTNLSETPTKLKSVMVYFFGGRFFFGSAPEVLYSPDYLLERDVVYVSVNFRLGALGFLSLNHTNATGNAALKDQRLSLKWIQANIEKFGGNPNNVTIFGHSSGGVSVSLLTLAEDVAGLFHGAISMSSTALIRYCFATTAEAVNRGETLGMMLGANSTDKSALLEAYYAASAERIVNVTESLRTPKGEIFVVPLPPTVEDKSIATEPFITECPVDKYKAGKFYKVPQMLGFLHDETLVYYNTTIPLSQVIDMSIEMYPSTQLIAVQNMMKSSGSISDEIYNALIQIAVSETTDIIYKAPIDTTQRLIVANDKVNPIYYYDISFYANVTTHSIRTPGNQYGGAAHADELAFLFYAPSNNYSHDLSDPAGLTIYRVSTMWSNFAKYGNPTPDWIDEYPLGVTWPPSGCSGLALDIGNELKVVRRPISPFGQFVEFAIYFNLTKNPGCTTDIWMPICEENGEPGKYWLTADVSQIPGGLHFEAMEAIQIPG